MYSKIFLNIILILSLVIIQLSFIAGLPAGLNYLNLILVILIFILGLVNLNFAAWWTVGIGLLLDIFSFAPFGIYLFCLCLTIIIADFALTVFFTNRSLYSFLALVGLTTAVYEILLTAIGYLVWLISREGAGLILNQSFWLSKLSQMTLNLIAALIIFYFISFVSKRLRPVFLARH
ncbi:MAG: hypothetical protein U9R14_03945 [Patescibacteria group bacterium]|nr:hypothetical protein [Patescibacteria group bacterium]